MNYDIGELVMYDSFILPHLKKRNRLGIVIKERKNRLNEAYKKCKVFWNDGYYVWVDEMLLERYRKAAYEGLQNEKRV